MPLSPSLFVHKYIDSGCYQFLPYPFILRASLLLLRPHIHPAAMCLWRENPAWGPRVRTLRTDPAWGQHVRFIANCPLEDLAGAANNRRIPLWFSVTWIVLHSVGLLFSARWWFFFRKNVKCLIRVTCWLCILDSTQGEIQPNAYNNYLFQTAGVILTFFGVVYFCGF
jgi:hypothetical protein